MEINWQQVPSDTIIETTRGAIAFAEPVTEFETAVIPDAAVRLYVVFVESDSKTLEQQVEALSETVELRVRLYDKTGHAAAIQTTEKYVSVIQNSPEVVRVKRETEAELTGSMDMGTVEADTATEVGAVATEIPQSESADGSAEIPRSESVAESVDVAARADEEQSVEEDAAQSAQIAVNAGGSDVQSVVLGVNEQETQTSQVLVTTEPVKNDRVSGTVLFGVLGCIIIAVVLVLVIRRK